MEPITEETKAGSEGTSEESLTPAEPVDAAQVEIDVYGKKMKIGEMLQFADSNCTRCWGRGLARFNGKYRMCRCAERNIVRQFGSRADRRKYGLATPAEKKEDEVEQLSASTIAKTERLREEIAKHEQVISELAGRDMGALNENSAEASAVTAVKIAEECAILDHQRRIADNTTAIREHRHSIAALESANATSEAAISELRAELANTEAKLQQLFDQRGKILAKNKPLLDAEIKRLEKVQRRLGLHLARHPETPATSTEIDPGPPAAL